MEYKLFNQPHSHDSNFYKDREMADHINQDQHRDRLLWIANKVIELSKDKDILTIGDFGCGNGGLLDYLKDKVTQSLYGYDLQPSNVEFAQRNDRNVLLKDFINEPVVYPDLMVCTETLEHLVSPHDFLSKVAKNTKYVLASTPGYETPSFHAPFHLWVWTDESFKDIFKDYEIIHFERGHWQYVVAKSNAI